MSTLLDSLRALALTLKSAFRPPVTVHYPAEKRPRAKRFRTSFALVHDANGDEACVGRVRRYCTDNEWVGEHLSRHCAKRGRNL